MNNIDMLTLAVEQEPGNSILQSMLEDALMEERDMLPHEAAMQVFRVSVVAQQSRDLRQAAELIRVGRRGSGYIRAAIIQAVFRGEQITGSIMLVPGDQHPLVCPRNHVPGDSLLAQGMVTVGAQWVVLAASRLKASRASARAAKRLA